jgi:hypothetical protein
MTIRLKSNSFCFLGIVTRRIAWTTKWHCDAQGQHGVAFTSFGWIRAGFCPALFLRPVESGSYPRITWQTQHVCLIYLGINIGSITWMTVLMRAM